MEDIEYEIQFDDNIPIDIYGPSGAQFLQIPESVEVSMV